MALHVYTYALGHYVTAKYWHLVEPDGLHFTISETGWGKAHWDTQRRRARRVSAAPDPVRGQVVKATIRLVKGTEPTEELIIRESGLRIICGKFSAAHVRRDFWYTTHVSLMAESRVAKKFAERGGLRRDKT